ncbi:MAG: nucleoside phosphorylase [Ruminococcus sp.]|nr:nucleoside phosphorylase [Ruminococcus sp.]
MASIMDTPRQFHIKTLKGEIGKYVILPGDPERVSVIAEYLDDAVFISRNREYTVYTGYLNGEKVTVCSTGIGGPSAAIAVEELIKCGADTFIRVGTSGGMAEEVVGGDLIIATAAVRGEGTSKEYLTPDYPAVASFEVVAALNKAAEKLSSKDFGNGYHSGVVHSKDSFYGEVEPDGSAVSENIKERWNAYLRSGCLASEMECAAIFSVGLVRKVRCAAVLTALWNVERSNKGLADNITNDSSRAIKCAIEAIKILIDEDKNE